MTALETTGFALFFLMLFVPAAYRPLKVVLLLPVLLATVVRTLVERRVALHPHVAFGCLLFSVLGVVFVLRGYLADAPGALRMSTVYVIWPWVNAFLLSSLADEARLWRLARLMVWTTIAICSYSVSFILWSAGWLPNALYLRLDQGQEIGFYGGFMEFGVRSMSSLLFLVPFVTGALVTGSHRFRAAHLWLALASGLAIGLLSGRRAFQLILVLGLPIAVAFRLGLPVKLRRRSGRRVRRTLVSAAAVCIAAVIAAAADLRAESRRSMDEIQDRVSVLQRCGGPIAGAAVHGLDRRVAELADAGIGTWGVGQCHPVRGNALGVRAVVCCLSVSHRPRRVSALYAWSDLDHRAGRPADQGRRFARAAHDRGSHGHDVFPDRQCDESVPREI